MSDKMPDAWIVPSASGDGYLCTLSHVNLPGWNRYVPAARIAELEAELAAERERRGSSSPEDIARRFHDAYERLAPQFGYSTRPESRREWDELPQNLRDLMIAVVRNVLIEQPAADAD